MRGHPLEGVEVGLAHQEGRSRSAEREKHAGSSARRCRSRPCTLNSPSLWVYKRSTSSVMLSSLLPAAFRGAYVMLLRKHLDGNTQLPAEILLLPTICIPIASGLEYTIASRDSIALYDMYSDIFSLFSLKYNANIRTDTYSDICRRPSAGLT